MSRIVVRRDEKVQLLSFTQDKCPLCGATKNHIRVVEERPVFGEDDYKLPKLVVLDTERSPRGAIDSYHKFGVWVLQEGIHPSWSNFKGWNSIRGKLYLVYPADAKIAVVGNRLERGEGFYNDKFIHAAQDRAWVLMGDQEPIKIEPFVREVSHASCVAEKILEKEPETVGVQGHLTVYKVPEEVSFDLRREFASARCGYVEENFIFLNHIVCRVQGDGEVSEMKTHQRSGQIVAFVRIEDEGFLVFSPDHPEELIKLDKGWFLFSHPVPQDGRDD